MITLDNTTWNTVAQLIAFLGSSAGLAVIVYCLRSFGLPDAKVPIVAHALGILAAVLIVVWQHIGVGTPITAQLIITALLAGVSSAFVAGGVHGHITHPLKSKPKAVKRVPAATIPAVKP